MKKQNYIVSIHEGGKVSAVVVEGYVVEKEIAGMTLSFGIRKEGKSWTVDELATGLSVNPSHKFGTRREALEYVDGKDAQTGRSLVEGMEKYVTNHNRQYEAEKHALEVIIERGKPVPEDERKRIVEKFAKAKKKQKKGAKVTLESFLAKMQEWCADKPNVSAYRKNEQECTPVRVVGETKPYKEELTEMGLRWSGKGFWYFGPRELAKMTA